MKCLNATKKRYLVCYLRNEGILSTKIFQISQNIPIEDCTYPEKTCAMMIFITEKTIEEVYNQIVGIMFNKQNLALFNINTQDIIIENNIVYIVNPLNGELIPRKLNLH